LLIGRLRSRNQSQHSAKPGADSINDYVFPLQPTLVDDVLCKLNSESEDQAADKKQHTSSRRTGNPSRYITNNTEN